MNESLITIRYVKALYELAEENKVLDKVEKDIESLLAILKESVEFNTFLDNPILKKSRKTALLNELFGNALDKLTLQFLHLLTENNREIYLKSICLHFIRYYRSKLGISEAVITTARPLSKQHRDEIYKFITRKFKLKLDLSEQVDEKIIGGFILRIEDQQINASMHAQLNKIKRELIHS